MSSQSLELSTTPSPESPSDPVAVDVVVGRRSEPETLFERFLSNGPAMLFVSSVTFAWMALSVRGLKRLSASETTFFRFFIGMAIMLVLHRITLLPLKFVNKKLLILRGVLGGAAVICYFTCIRKTDAATATLLNNSYPIFALLTGLAIGTVKPAARLLLLLALSLAGMVVVTNPGAGVMGSGAIYGIASALFAGAALVVIEKARTTDSAQATFVSMCVGGMTIGLLGVVMGGEGVTLPHGPELGWILLLGVTSTIAQLLMNHALLYVGATEGSIVSVTTTAFTALFAWLLFGDRPAWNFFVGAALILTSAVVAALTLARRKEAAAG